LYDEYDTGHTGLYVALAQWHVHDVLAEQVEEQQNKSEQPSYSRQSE